MEREEVELLPMLIDTGVNSRTFGKSDHLFNHLFSAGKPFSVVTPKAIWICTPSEFLIEHGTNVEDFIKEQTERFATNLHRWVNGETDCG